MDDQVFDALARRFAGARSRRQALATLGGGALTAAFVGLGRADVAAQDVSLEGCRAHLDLCKNDDQCCGSRDNDDITCDRVSRKCNKHLNRNRCVGDKGAKCGNSCDCARGLRCKGSTCR